MMSATAHQSASTTTEDASESGLPAFTTFQATDLETSWDYYERVVAHPNADLAAQAANYTRPWEMESKEHQQQQQQQQLQQQQQQQQRGFEPFPKLPSFQSQFHSFADNNLVPEPSLPTQVTAVPVPISPSSGSPSGGSLTQLTQLTPSPLTTLQPTLTTLPQPNFHTLATIPVQTTRSYPLVPAPIQARDIPSIQQQYIDERHIQLYQPITTAATFHHPAPPQPHQGIVTVLKNEQLHFDIKNGHHTSFQGSPMENGSFMDSSIMSTPKHSNKSINGTPTSHNVKETRKKERRKIRASSLESSTESDASSAMDIDGNSSGNPGQVAAVSSTDNFKSPMHMDNGDHSTSTSEKQAKQKKRKRCGECVGCQKKDNCGECAPCRNDKSHQICKQRRCEKLTEKKIIYSADGTIVRGESRRGRGKGRGGTSYRGRKALNLGGVVSPRAKQSQKASNSPQPAAVPQQSPNTISSQPGLQQQANLIGVTTTPNTPQQPQQQSQQQIPSTTTQIMKEHHQQPMTPMAFYPAWQTTATAATTDHAWQNQFIQQIPQNGNAPSAVSASTIAPLNSLEFQQGYAYPANGYVQTTGLQFDPNYSRTATTYSSPTIQRYEFQAQQIVPNQVSLQSVSFAPNVTYSQIASPAVLLNHQQHQSPYHQQHELINKPMTMSATLTTSSGNDMPGYPRVNSVPPRSLNCSGYPGLSEYGGNSINTTSSMAQQTNTSSSLTTQMHPPLTQSPSSQPSRPGSSNQMYQQQSPSHFSSPTSQAQSPSINGNSYQTESQQDWNQNSWNGNASQPSDIFNQSDRINLNTRLKTMILHKSDKDQQQQQPGNHFLSHSHQHLTEQQQQLANSSVLNNNNNNSTKSNNNNSSNETKQLSEEGAGDVGGFDRSPVMKQDKDEIKSKDFFEQKQQLMEKNSDPGGGEGIEAKQSNFSNESVEREAPLPPPSSAERKDDRNDRQSYSYHSAHEYQQHKNMVNNIKKEACDGETPPPPGGNVKFEGYEKNYQNFIRYADFCDAQQPQSFESPHPKPTTPYQQDYMQSQGYYNNYPYQNYGPPGQNYAQQHSQSYQQFMSQQHSSLTNFEQQIPLHTYPIPKHIGETIFSPTSIKTEPNLQPYPPFGESHDKDEHYRGAVNEESPTGLVQAKEEAKEMEGLNRPHSNQSCYHQIEKDKTEEIQAKAPTPKPPTSGGGSSRSKKQAQKDIYNERNNKPEVPDCDCFSSEKKPPEPGSYYTHLGCAATLEELRKEIEARTGFSGKQLRIEKVLYTGKEGKSSQGCPIAKWVIRRVDAEEKALFVVKRRQGHRCKAAFVVISIVVWEAMPLIEADNMYKLLVHKLNKFGLPTTRRCATNENRTCACQGLDPETCGASYSFGCSWSMYYNGCKYARSKTVRKFRLSVKSEEAEIEERMNIIATILSPMYKTIAPKAYLNQVQYETEAPDCRLGLKYGKPFSGVTCCVDFCAHTHRDLHNMQDGCTVQATLLKPRPYGMAHEDEQLHVLPLYTMDATDEFDSEEGQKKKHETGAVTVLEKYATEVRVRSTPLQPCRRHGKKRGNGTMGDEEPPLPPPPVLAPPQPITPVPPPVLTPTKDPKSKSRSRSKSSNNSAQLPQPPSIPSQNTQSQQSAFTSPNQLQQQQQQQQQQQTPPNNNSPSQQTQLPGAPANGNNSSTLLDMASMIDTFTDAQLQSNQISSTVLDSPYSYDYQTGQYIDNRQFHYQWQQDYNKMRAEEISPDTTTRPGSSNSSNNSNSAFSPNIAQQQNQALYESNNNMTGDHQQQHHHHQQQQYHQLETAFVKPKAPAHSYGNYPPHQLLPQHPNNYQLYSTYPYDPYGYNSYGNYSSNYPAYGSMNYGQSAPPQTPNWGLYQNSPMPPSATPVIPPQYPPNFQQQTQLGSPAQQNMSSSPSKMSEALGEVTEINDNLECFQDKQMGGVAISLPHGSVVIECAKLEMHSTTSLKKPNRLNPNRISLIFYQHRNLNRPKHGTLEWAEKMRLKKLGITTPDNDPDLKELLEEDMKQEFMDEEEEAPPPTPKPAKKSRSKKDKHVIEEKISSSVSPKCKSEGPGKTYSHSKSPALTATSWTTLFPMHPCGVTGPYKGGSATESPPPLEGHQPTTDPLAITKA